ncbi:MAG TPA: glutaredoxin family protein [Bacteroidota bacterium]|nr:glutaredoxin family protein [Bacteroidota bacterium]
MITVELYSKDNCSLCDEVKELLKKLRKDYAFRLIERHLMESAPRYQEFATKFPVVIIDGQELSGKVSEADLRNLLDPGPPTFLFFVAKFLEALGMITVLFGFMYGLLGDMWTDLYFFIGGIVIFYTGRVLERQEETKRRARKRAEQQFAHG